MFVFQEALNLLECFARMTAAILLMVSALYLLNMLNLGVGNVLVVINGR